MEWGKGWWNRIPKERHSVETIKNNPRGKEQWLMIAVILLYILIHLPFVGIGFGEPDGWRNGLAALNFGKGLGYEPSRVPGFPVVELSFGLVAKWVPAEQLWIYTNLLTLLISLVGMIIYFNIARFHRISRPWLPVLLLYFLPVIFINTAFSMDNLWALTFILAAYWFLLQVKPLRATVCFGLAIGCRLTSALTLFPFLLCMVWNPRLFPKREAIRSTVFLLLSVLILALMYLLINRNFFGPFNAFAYLNENFIIPRDYFRSGYYVLQEVFGLPGTLFLVGMIVWHWKKFPDFNWESSFLILVACLYGLLFLYRPEKPAYLIPVLPFLLLWISRWLTGSLSYMLTGLIILNNIISIGVIDPTPEGLSFNKIDKGISWKLYQRYQRYSRDADYLIRFPYLPDSEVQMGYRHPGVVFFLELPTYQKRKGELINNRIIFPEHLGVEKKNNTYWVFGSLSYKIERKFLSSTNYKVIYLPDARTGP